MNLLTLKILIGFGVGTLIGMTGLGGGVLLLPILIFGLGVPAITAVGSDAAFNFVTKIGSSWMHLRRGTVRRKVVLALAAGSAPGSYLGADRLVEVFFELYGQTAADSRRGCQRLHQDRGRGTADHHPDPAASAAAY